MMTPSAVAKLIAKWRENVQYCLKESDRLADMQEDKRSERFLTRGRTMEECVNQLEVALLQKGQAKGAVVSTWGASEHITVLPKSARLATAPPEQADQLVERWEQIAEHGEGTPATDNFYFRCAMERCAAELKATFGTPLAAHDQKMREPLTAWMIENSFATGHGDTVEDLLKELKWQIKESNQKVRREIECQIILQLMGAEPYLGRGHVESGGEFIWTVVADKVSVLALASPAQAANKPEASHE